MRRSTGRERLAELTLREGGWLEIGEEKIMGVERWEKGNSLKEMSNTCKWVLRFFYLVVTVAMLCYSLPVCLFLFKEFSGKLVL